MPKSEVYTEVNGQRIKLTNLEKILFPKLQISKAEVVQYYLTVAPHILRYIKNRPLTLIRFPDGVDKAGFYAKTKPDWTPDWISSFDIKHSEETIPYLLAKGQAEVVWIANLGGLEIHPMQFSADQQNPDHFIFDLDPPEDFHWDDLVEIAYKLKAFCAEHGYSSFIKTSGGKGLHIYVPIRPIYPQEEMVQSVKNLSAEFIKRNRNLVTLKMNKEKRKGKMFLDIFRNHRGHTTVAPFSLRGKPDAPVSMPFLWSDLEHISSSQHFTLKNYKEYLDLNGNVWLDWRNFERELHDKRSSQHAVLTDHSLLNEYAHKRDFKSTNEPPALVESGENDEYVVQLHNASRLHYDLRLEVDGVLYSWAIPKGLPIKTGVKRLAIRTENHPMKYVDFEGTIPKGEYGAGEMWIASRGKYKLIKNKKDSLSFEFESGSLNGKFSIYHTKEDQWIIERKSSEQTLSFIEPMLVEQKKSVPNNDKYLYEIKWDGIRCILVFEKDSLKIYSKSGRDLSSKFPELSAHRNKIKATNAIMDAEIVCLSPEGVPDFSKVISRMHLNGPQKIVRARKTNPVFCYVFDLLHLDGIDTTKDKIEQRKEWLDVLIERDGHFRHSEFFADGKELFEACKKMGMEGIMAKQKGSSYYTKQRSSVWAKIKFRSHADCYILGYTKGQGDRSSLFGSIHLGVKEEGVLVYKGRVGTGFDSIKMNMLLERFSKLKTKKQYIEGDIEKVNETIWLKPELLCEIKYASLTSNGTFREPVFVRLKEIE